MNADFFSKSLLARLDAIKDLGENPRSEKMPAGCRGSLNAWAIFLGSNPGGGQEGSEGIWRAALGKGLGQPFADKDRRNSKWNKLFLSVLQNNQEAVNHLSALYNLTPRATKRASELHRDEMPSGCEKIWEAGSLACPRFVVALAKPVFTCFSTFLQTKHGSRVEDLGEPQYQPIRFNWPNAKFSSFLVWAPRHPSYGLSLLQLQTLQKQTAILDQFD